MTLGTHGSIVSKRIIRALRDAWASRVTVPRLLRQNERAYRAYRDQEDEPGYAYEDHR